LITLEGARPFLEKALVYTGGTHSFDDICAGVATGQFVFWPGINSAVITEVIEYPQKRTLQYFLAGGNLAELEAMYPVVEAYGRKMGCTLASTSGRPGWERTFLKREGWKPITVMMTKEL
jgi:hypothetical protein